MADRSKAMPEYDPRIPHRRSIRLKGHDYASPGAYFVTVCVANRECLLGHVADGRMIRSKTGTVVRDCWRALPARFRHIDIDEWCVMPNHFHGIIFILDVPPGSEGGRQNSRSVAPPPDSSAAAALTPVGTGLTAGSLSVIVRAFKASSTRRADRIRGSKRLSLWQRGYYDRIIRNERELSAIRKYIDDNPISWELDRENPVRPSTEDR